jgi:hypothetical protein
MGPPPPLVEEVGLRYSRVALETEHRIAEFFTVP